MLQNLSFFHRRKIEILLGISVFLNLCFWVSARHIQSRWANVPPAPSAEYAASTGLGDVSLSYRVIGLMLQNLGDTGGRVTALKDYNFDELARWFAVEHFLDPRSNYTPYLAAYYFSAVQEREREKLRPLIRYLAKVGLSEQGEKWRFLAQAVYLSRFVLKDIDLSLDLAKKMASHPKKDLPLWTKNMPAFVMNQNGDKKEAYGFLVEIIRSSSKSLHPNEITNMRYYICHQVLSAEEAKFDPLCKDIPAK